MRIVFLNREYPPHTVFLSTSFLYQRMAKAFVRQGHEVHVITQSDGKPLERDDEGVLVHEVGSNVNRGSARARISYSYNAWRKLRELRHDVDVVNADYFLGEGSLYSLSNRKPPLVLQAHAWAEGWIYDPGISGLMKKKVAGYFEKIAARRAAYVIATSKFTYQWLVDKVGLPKDRVKIVYEFIDTNRYKPVKSSFRQKIGIQESSKMVLFVAGLEPRKGPIVLAEAIPLVLHELPDARFVFVGRDTNLAPGGASMKSHIQQLAEKSGFQDKIVFPGMISMEDIAGAYSACDVFVYPGLMEAGGLPPLEAMACNCPVVATATGSAAELKDVSPAFLVIPPNDSKALAQAIIRLLSLPQDELKGQAAKHRQIVEEQFSFDRMITEILAVYADAIANPKPN
ncbi:MAG TPA: glycosyltransferase family 4 protein [Candidatus Bathyarchaeia archaeon]|nr:glycosyltransferase family 4 protein [Candidatus Bathyarchaeia archaeon]